MATTDDWGNKLEHILYHHFYYTTGQSALHKKENFFDMYDETTKEKPYEDEEL